MSRPRAADDFEAVQKRLAELKAERERAVAADPDAPATTEPQSDLVSALLAAPRHSPIWWRGVA